MACTVRRLPARQRRGIGLSWQTYSKTGHDLRAGTEATTTRRHLRTDDTLPTKDDYRHLLEKVRAPDPFATVRP